MDNILALDASTHRTGYAYYDINNNLQYGAIASSSLAVERRIIIMREEIIKILEANPHINTIILEDVRPDNFNNRTERVLKWLQGNIVTEVYDYNRKIKIELIGASSWRSELGIQKYRTKREPQKQIDIDFVNEKYNLNLTSEQDDEADAIGILTAVIKNKNSLLNTNIESKKPTDIGSEESAF